MFQAFLKLTALPPQTQPRRNGAEYDGRIQESSPRHPAELLPNEAEGRASSAVRAHPSSEAVGSHHLTAASSLQPSAPETAAVCE